MDYTTTAHDPVSSAFEVDNFIDEAMDLEEALTRVDVRGVETLGPWTIGILYEALRLGIIDGDSARKGKIIEAADDYLTQIAGQTRKVKDFGTVGSRNVCDLAYMASLEKEDLTAYQKAELAKNVRQILEAVLPLIPTPKEENHTSREEAVRVVLTTSVAVAVVVAASVAKINLGVDEGQGAILMDSLATLVGSIAVAGAAAVNISKSARTRFDEFLLRVMKTSKDERLAGEQWLGSVTDGGKMADRLEARTRRTDGRAPHLSAIRAKQRIAGYDN